MRISFPTGLPLLGIFFVKYSILIYYSNVVNGHKPSPFRETAGKDIVIYDPLDHEVS